MADYTLSAKITGDSTGFEKAFSTAQKTRAKSRTSQRSWIVWEVLLQT